MTCPLSGTCWSNRQGPTGEHHCIHCGARITNKLWDYVHYSDEEARPGFERLVISHQLTGPRQFLFDIVPVKHRFTQVYSGTDWRLAKIYNSIKAAVKEANRLERLLEHPSRKHLHQWWFITEVHEEFGLLEFKEIS